MRILVVHDRKDVADEIGSIIQEVNPDCTVKRCSDYQGARDILLNDFFDLMIVDLTLPIEIGSSDPSHGNVERLLKNIRLDPRFKKPGDILGVTRDIEALHVIDVSISKYLMATVEQDAKGLWKQTIREKLQYVQASRRSREVVSRITHDVDLGIVVALEKEAKPYKTVFELSESDHSNIRFFKFRCKRGKTRRGVLLTI